MQPTGLFLFGFQLGNPGFEGFKLGPCASKHFSLNIELFTGDQIQLGKGATKKRFYVLLYVL